MNIRRHLLDREAMIGEPAIEVGRLAGPDLMPEARAEEMRAMHQTCVGREHEIGQPLPRRHSLNDDTQADEPIVQGLPLFPGPFG